MDQVTHNRIFAFNWGVADDVLRETEQVPLLDEGGIEAFIRRGMLRYTPDAWVSNDTNKIGCRVRVGILNCAHWLHCVPTRRCVGAGRWGWERHSRQCAVRSALQ